MRPKQNQKIGACETRKAAAWFSFCGCGTFKELNPMKFKGLLAATVAVALVGLANVNTAQAGLFGGCGGGGCCGQTVGCGPSWGGCAPANCDPCNCSVFPACGPRRCGLFKKLVAHCRKSSSCCEMDSCCESAPTCGAPMACAPACGAAAPSCGCEVAAATCGAPADCCAAPCKRRGGLLAKLFGGCHKSADCCGCDVAASCDTCAPACGAPAPSCGAAYAPSCGCP